MCGVLGTLAPLLVGGVMQAVSGGMGSHTPDELPITTSNPEPPTPEASIGIDNTDTSAKTAKNGRSALVIGRNPSVGLSGDRRSGVNVARG